MHAQWMRRGLKSDALPLEKEYAEKVRAALAAGEALLWESVARGAKLRLNGDDGGIEYDQYDTAAGRLALAALHTRWGKRYLGWRLKEQGAGVPLQEASRQQASVSLAALDPEELDRYEELAAKARTDFTSMSLEDVAELQSLLRKARAPEGSTEDTLAVDKTPPSE